MDQSNHETKPSERKYIWGLGLLLSAIIVGLMAWLLPGGVDFTYYFYPATRAWLAGQSILYDQYSGIFAHLPWSIWLILPYAVWPRLIGLSLLRLFSLVVIIMAIDVFTRHGYRQAMSLAFAMFNLHTFDLLNRGQLDIYSVLGIVFGWLAINQRKPWLLAAGLITMMVKPTVTLPIALFLLWLAWKRWNFQEVLIAVIAPTCVVILSFIVYGFWPPRLQAIIAASPYFDIWLSTIWRMQEMLALPSVVSWLIAAAVAGISIWTWIKAGRLPDSDARLARLILIITTTFLVTPYALGYYYVVILAIVLPVLLDWRLDLGLMIYALTFLPIIRHWIGAENAWIDLVFVLVNYAGVILYILYKPTDETRLDQIEPAPGSA